MDRATEVDTAPWTPLLPPLDLGDGYRIRELPPDEWHRMGEAGGFYADGEKIPAPNANCRVVVAEFYDGDFWEVVGYCPVFDAVHAEPLHFREDARHHPHLQKAFLGGLVTLLQLAGVRYLWATIADGHTAAEGIIRRLGFKPIEGRTWTGKIPPPLE